MRPSRWISRLSVAAYLLAVCVTGSRGADRSAEARLWLDKALDLDVGAVNASDVVQAYAAMLRAAEAGDPEAALDVAIMLDSGRGVTRDVAAAAVWYARAAVRGERRGAFNLGMLYERGEGVPANADLSRAWYAASHLPAAREHLANLGRAGHRPAQLLSPKPQFPVGQTPPVDGQRMELVWTSALQPEPVRYFVEVRGLDDHESKEVWSGFVDVSSVRLPLSASVGTLAWRVSAVAKGSSTYAVSPWSFLTPPGAVNPPMASNAPLSAPPIKQASVAQARESVEAVRPTAPSKPPPEKTQDRADAKPQAVSIVPAATTPAIPSQPDPPKKVASAASQEHKPAPLAPPPPTEVAVSAVPPANTAATGRVAPSVLIILTQPNVASPADLNNKAVVIAGLHSISLGAVETALHAAGAGNARLTEGTKDDIDRLVDGDVSAAVVAFVSSTKAQSFPEISGFHLLRVGVSDLSKR